MMTDATDPHRPATGQRKPTIELLLRSAAKSTAIRAFTGEN